MLCSFSEVIFMRTATFWHSHFIQAQRAILLDHTLKDDAWLAYLHLEDIAGRSRLVKAPREKLAERIDINFARAEDLIEALYLKHKDWCEPPDPDEPLRLAPRPKSFIKVHTWVLRLPQHIRFARIFYHIVDHFGPGERVINFNAILRTYHLPGPRSQRGHGKKWAALKRQVERWQEWGLISILEHKANTARRCLVHHDVLDAVTAPEQVYRRGPVHHGVPPPVTTPTGAGTPHRTPRPAAQDTTPDTTPDTTRNGAGHHKRRPTESQNPQNPAEAPEPRKNPLEPKGLTASSQPLPDRDDSGEQGCRPPDEDEVFAEWWRPGLWDDPEEGIELPRSTLPPLQPPDLTPPGGVPRPVAARQFMAKSNLTQGGKPGKGGDSIIKPAPLPRAVKPPPPPPAPPLEATIQALAAEADLLRREKLNALEEAAWEPQSLPWWDDTHQYP